MFVLFDDVQLKEAGLVENADGQEFFDSTIATGYPTSRKSSTQTIASGSVTPRVNDQNTATGVTLSTESIKSGGVLTPGNAHVISPTGQTGLPDKSLVCVMYANLNFFKPQCIV